VAQSISDILVFLLLLHRHIVLVAFSVVVVVGDRSMQSFLLPLDAVLEGDGSIPRSVSDEAVFVGKGENLLGVDVPPGEAQVRQIQRSRAAGVKIGVDSGNSSLVGPIEPSDGVPYLALHLEVILEVGDDGVVGTDLDLIVVLVKFGLDVIVRVGVLMGKHRVGFVVKE
jgi:hypothetical protein